MQNFIGGFFIQLSFSVVSVVSCWFLRLVFVMLCWCFGDISMTFRWCFSYTMSRWCFGDVSVLFWLCHGGVSEMFWRCLGDVSVLIQYSWWYFTIYFFSGGLGCVGWVLAPMRSAASWGQMVRGKNTEPKCLNPKMPNAKCMSTYLLYKSINVTKSKI